MTMVVVQKGDWRASVLLSISCKYFLFLTALTICFFAKYLQGLNRDAHLLMVLEICLILEVITLSRTVRIKSSQGCTNEKGYDSRNKPIL